jgi:hypothetical protein
MNNGFAKAFEFRSRPDLKKLSIGKHEIDRDNLLPGGCTYGYDIFGKHPQGSGEGGSIWFLKLRVSDINRKLTI